MEPKSSQMQLAMLGLPKINNLEDFSSLTHLSKKMVYNFSKYSDKYYHTYSIPKKTGGSRLIAQPSRNLKALQGWILKEILEKLNISDVCKGFEKNTSVLDNAKPHIGSNSVLIVDIENFFPTINANKVCNIFKTIGYNPKIASILTSICTFSGGLPQGGPSSPKLSNLVCLRLDNRLQGYVGKRFITYTRYADDLNFSALVPSRLFSAFPMIKIIIEEEGFKLNDSKTRFFGPARAKRVTGLIVTEKMAGIGRKRLRELRAKIHQFSRRVLHPTQKKEIKESIQIELEHIKGWLGFVNSVDKNRAKKLEIYINNLKKNCSEDSAISLLNFKVS